MAGPVVGLVKKEESLVSFLWTFLKSCCIPIIQSSVSSRAKVSVVNGYEYTNLLY